MLGEGLRLNRSDPGIGARRTAHLLDLHWLATDAM
jgi:hypothetical protein